MGVNLLLYWRAADGAGRREAFDALLAAILCLGTAGSTRWTAQAAVLRPTQQKDMNELASVRARSGGSEQALHRVTFSDEPDQVVLLSRAAKQVVQAGADMQAFLDRVVQLKARGMLQLEGQQHAVGDFMVSVARAVQAPQQDFLGLVVDVCYQPLDDAELAAPLLQDMAEVLQEAAEAAGGTLRQVGPAAAAGFELPVAWGPQHRAAQYVQLMTQLQEQAG